MKIKCEGIEGFTVGNNTTVTINGTLITVPGLSAVQKVKILKRHYTEEDNIERELYANLHNHSDGDIVNVEGIDYVIQFNGDYSNFISLFINDVAVYEKQKLKVDASTYNGKCVIGALNEAIRFIKANNPTFEFI